MCSGMLAVGRRRRNARLEQPLDVGRPTVSSAAGRPGSTNGDAGAGPGQRPSRSSTSEHLGDDHGIGQHRIDPVADLGRQRFDILAGRGLGERHGQHVAVELQGHGAELLRPRSSGMAATASGLGVIAARSTAGSWARWASAPTTTPGRASFLLISSVARGWPVASPPRAAEPDWTRSRSHP